MNEYLKWISIVSIKFSRFEENSLRIDKRTDRQTDRQKTDRQTDGRIQTEQKKTICFPSSIMVKSLHGSIKNGCF